MACSGPSMACRKWCSKAVQRIRPGGCPVWGITTLSSLPERTTRVEPILGLTQTQSTPGGTGSVPLLVSMAISEAHLACRASSGVSNCNGSPPVQPYLWRCRLGRPLRIDGRGQISGGNELAPALAVRAHEIGVAELADGAGAGFVTVPQVAARKRQNTAGRPAWRPSPCRV